jgi:hypothetical protein
MKAPLHRLQTEDERAKILPQMLPPVEVVSEAIRVRRGEPEGPRDLAAKDLGVTQLV